MVVDVAVSLKSLIIGASKFSVPMALSAVLSLVLIPVISRVYPPDDYGKINLFYTLGNFIMTFGLLGLDNAFIRFFQEPLKGLGNSKAFSLCLYVGSCVVLVIFAFVFLVSPAAVSEFMFGESCVSALAMLLVYSLSLIIFRLLSIVTRQEFDALSYNIQQILLILSNRVLFVVAVAVSTNYYPSIFVMTAVTAISAIAFLWAKRKKYMVLEVLPIPEKSLRTFFLFALPTMPAALLVWLNSSAAKLLLAGFGQYDEMGVFSIAFMIANAFSVIPSAFAIYWSPFVYSHYKTEVYLIKKVQDLITLLTVVLVILFTVFQDPIYALLGTEYNSSQPYFMVIMLFPIQALLVETVGYGIYLANKTQIRLAICALSALLNVVLSAFLIPKYGGLGASFGLGFSALVVLVGSSYFGQKYFESIMDKKRTLGACLIIVMLCFGNVFGAMNLIIRLLLILLALAATAILYFKPVIQYFKER